jgi:predicted PolB exonuclease-like 3'-5' exonuclease
MKKIIAIDLETIADPSMLSILPEVTPAGNLKDPAKIEADIEKKKKAQISGMGLSPMTNMICCAGWWDSAGKSGAVMLDAATGEAEKNLLLEFWDLLSGYDHFVTFNGRSFDLRCMLLHGISCGIRPSVNIDHGRYNKAGSNHTDLRPILAGEDKFAPGKLDFFCKKFLGDQTEDHKTEDIDGALVQGYWDMGLIDEIRDYCIQDCNLTYRLFEKVKTAGLVE